MTAEEREHSATLVYQLLPSRYGMNPDDLRKADAIEVVVGQGAKPGGGGMLLGQKISDRVAYSTNVRHSSSTGLGVRSGRHGSEGAASGRAVGCSPTATRSGWIATGRVVAIRATRAVGGEFGPAPGTGKMG